MEKKNEIAKSNISISDMMDMAKAFIESKMFPDIQAVGAAFVKIQAGKEIGISPFAAMSGIHIIKGKAAIGAGLMAGCVKGSGKYDYKVLKLDATACSIDFLQNGKIIGNSTFTIEDARKAGTQNLEKFPKNMLFARAMSNGVKWYCPDVFTMPVYTPEEMGGASVTEDIAHELIQAISPEEEIKDAIEKLPNCNSVDELKLFKETLPLHVITNEEFKLAATKRFNEVK